MSSSSGSEVAPPRVISWKFILLVALLAAGTTIFSHVAAAYTPGWTGGAVGGGFATVVMFLMVILGNLFPHKINRAHILLISAVTAVSIFHWWPADGTGFAVLGVMIAARTAPSPWRELLDWVYGPGISEIQKLLSGGVSDVPWSAWMPSLAWWSVYYFLWFIFFHSFFSIIRRRWLDIELLPYPSAIPTIILLDETRPDKRLKGVPPSRRLDFLLVGMICGFFYMWPPVLKVIVPWFPDIYGWSSYPFIPWAMGAMYAEAVPLFRRLVGFCWFTTNIGSYLSWMLLPLDIILSVIIVRWFVAIVEQIAYYRGYYSGILQQTSSGKRALLGGYPPMKMFLVYFTAGMTIILFWMIVNWRYFVDTIKAAIRGPTKEEWEREIMPYRLAWTLFIVSGFLLVALLYAAGCSLRGSFLIVLSWFLIGGCGMRTTGLAFGYAPSDWPYCTTLVTSMYRSMGVISVEQATGTYVMDVALGQQDSRPGISPGYQCTWYKIARELNVRPREVFVSLLVAVAIICAITFPFLVKFYYSVGAAKTVRGSPEGWGWWLELLPPSSWEARPAVRPWWPWIITTAAAMLISTYLRMRFVWWPIDPVGIVMGATDPADMDLIIPVVAYIIKFLVIKLGGAKIHDEILLPFVGGWGMGAGLTWFVGGIAVLPRYIG